MNRKKVLFMDLPSEIVVSILSVLPVRSIISCKCVCKSWLELLSSHEYAKAHLLKSKPGLVVSGYEWNSEPLKIFEYEDSPDDLESHELHYNLVTKLNRRAFISQAAYNAVAIQAAYNSVAIQGSANGFLFMRETKTQPNALYICNPITRDYIELPSPEGGVYHYPSVVTYGFGVSKMSGQHKVVRIFHDCVRDHEARLLSIPKSICQVYTLGTGSWRSIAPGAPLEYNCRSVGAFLNGKFHWLVRDLMGCWWISCFDLQTEVFSTFSPPPELPRSKRFVADVVDLGDCLCLCDNTSESEIVIWLMKEYGVEKSWTKEYVISKVPNFTGNAYEAVYPIKVFKDGDILMAWKDCDLFYYSRKLRGLSSNTNMFVMRYYGHIEGMSYTPSFVSLKFFTMEDANSFRVFKKEL